MRMLMAAVVLASLTSACVPEGLAFRVDERVRIVSPEDEQAVTLPLTIDWDVEDFDGSFAVFIDRSPVGPGKALPTDVPDRVLVTTDTAVVLEALPATSRDRDVHTATIVLIDGDGRRTGESAFDVTFEVEER